MEPLSPCAPFFLTEFRQPESTEGDLQGRPFKRAESARKRTSAEGVVEFEILSATATTARDPFAASQQLSAAAACAAESSMNLVRSS
jgi:hypothetical protein